MINILEVGEKLLHWTSFVHLCTSPELIWFDFVIVISCTYHIHSIVEVHVLTDLVLNTNKRVLRFIDPKSAKSGSLVPHSCFM